MRFVRFTRRIAFVAALVVAPFMAHDVAAQTGTIRGTVSDSVTNRGVPAVQVTVAGSTRGAITSETGAYTLRNVPAGSALVRVQRIGFAAAEQRVTVPSNDSVTANFTLRPVAALLSTVVSIGYGTNSRQNVSSAISSVTAAEIANTPLAGVDAALQGKMPGVQVMQNGGNPGNGISIRVRGPASINAGNQPLYVVDGVPILQENYTQLGLGGQDVTAVTGLNPDEVATIDVLKDAAATAIYGSRGSNGVVLITTKRGQSGKSRITFNAYAGSQDANTRVKLLDAKQYVDLMNESAKNDDYDVSDYDFVPG
ncbi:MAG: TonB-dependent receptor plug domain-containing protein, partial [bacterium]